MVNIGTVSAPLTARIGASLVGCGGSGWCHGDGVLVMAPLIPRSSKPLVVLAGSGWWHGGGVLVEAAYWP